MNTTKKQEYLNLNIKIKKKPFLITIIAVLSFTLVLLSYLFFFDFIYPVITTEINDQPINALKLENATSILNNNGIRYVTSSDKTVLLVCQADRARATDLLDNAGIH